MYSSGSRRDNTARMRVEIVKFSVPVKCDHCEFSFNNSRALDQHIESEHQSESDTQPEMDKIKEESIVCNEDSVREDNVRNKPEEEIHVKYELDSVQNLKKAKANLNRSTNLTRIQIDDTNT